MKVSVVIPHLRGTETLIPLLEDLKRERGEKFQLEVILVDNASTDGSSELAKEKHPWIKVSRSKVNLGYAGGCNKGIAESSGEWIWLLNDDVRLDQGVIKSMLVVGESAPDIAAIQPKIMALKNPGYFEYAGGAGGMIDMFGFPFALGRIGGDVEEDKGQYDSPREIFWASGTACLWKKKALDSIGLLDDSFFAHMEEIDLAWRAWICGWRIFSAPAGIVHHLGGGTLTYQSWKKMYLNHRNSLITLLKNRETKALLWLFPVRFLMDNMVGFGELLQGRPGRLSAVWAGWFGMFRRLSTVMKDRRIVQRLRTKRDKNIESVVYKGSILYDYVKGVRNASQLVAQVPSKT